MRSFHPSRLALMLASAGLLGLAVACGGNSSTATDTLPPPSGNVNLSISDASTEDWSVIGVKVLGVTLTPQDGSTPVTVYTAPAQVPVVNLCQLDQLSELLGNVQVPQGTYTKATLTLAANPGDVTLVAASTPSSDFPLPGGTAVDPANIQIKHTTGTSPNLTTSIELKLETPLVVTATSSNALDLEFILSHPTFIVEHMPVAGGVLWAVNFNGTMRHRPHYDVTEMVLRHAYGLVKSVASDNTSFDMVKEYEALPVPAGGPTPIATLQTLTIKADATNGTLVYDLDAKSTAVLKDFSSLAGTLAGKQVRVAARYQSNGTLTAVRVWISSSWPKVWVSPEGHINHVDSVNNLIYIDDENGISKPIAVDANTKFFFRTPAKALAETTPIGTGPAFLANLARGFKVHMAVADPLAATLTASTVDIEIARFDGWISNATSTAFTYTRNFRNKADNYTINLPYCAATTANGKDAAGNVIQGFKWWNFSFPTLANTGTNAIPDFVKALSGGVDFGGTVGPLKAWGMSYANWGDTANPTAWSTKWSVLEPMRLPAGTVTTPLAVSGTTGTFSITVLGGTNTVPVTLSTVSGSAALVNNVTVSGGIITITPLDITSSAGQTTLASLLVNGAKVRVFGIPQPDGTIKGYVVNVFH